MHAITFDWGVIGSPLHHAVRHPAHTIAALVVSIGLGTASPVDAIGDGGLCDLPRIAAAQPLVGDLGLPPIADFLIKDAEFIADAVADRRTFERRERVEVTRGQ